RSARASGERALGSLMAARGAPDSGPREPVPRPPLVEPLGHGPCEGEVGAKAEDGGRRVGAVENGGRRLVTRQETLEGGQVARALRWIPEGRPPDGVEARQDQLRELVDVG